MKKMKPAKGTAMLQSCECKYVKMGIHPACPCHMGQSSRLVRYFF